MLNRRSFFAASAAGVAGAMLPGIAPALEVQTVRCTAPPTGGMTVYYYPAGDEKAKAEVWRICKAGTCISSLCLPRNSDGLDGYGIERFEDTEAGRRALDEAIRYCLGKNAG